MRRPVLPIIGLVLAVAGLALLAVQVIRVVAGSALGSVGVVLLWVGVGGLAIGLLVLAASATDDVVPAAAAPPVRDDPIPADDAPTRADDPAAAEPARPVQPEVTATDESAVQRAASSLERLRRHETHPEPPSETGPETEPRAGSEPLA